MAVGEGPTRAVFVAPKEAAKVALGSGDCTNSVDGMSAVQLNLNAGSIYTATITGYNDFMIGVYSTDGSSFTVSTTDVTVAAGMDYALLSTSSASTCFYSGGPYNTQASCASAVSTTVSITCTNLNSPCPLMYQIKGSYLCPSISPAGAVKPFTYAVTAVAAAAAAMCLI